MKLKKEFIVHNNGEQQIMVSTDKKVFSGLVKNNETAAFLVNLLENDISFEEIIAAMKKEYDVTEDVLRRDVEKGLEILKRIGAIEE